MPIELEWARKWLVVEVLSNNTLRIRGSKLHRDIIVTRYTWFFSTQDPEESCDLCFIPTADTDLITPIKEKHNPKKSSVDIHTPAAIDFIVEKTNKSLSTVANDAIANEVQRIISSMALNIAGKYDEEMGVMPAYLVVFNSVVSTNFDFLRSLQKKYGGKVNLDQMRWTAFDADSLRYVPIYTNN
jgi:hypothetical protein